MDLAKPVFDIDSIGLISLLQKMNQGIGSVRTLDDARAANNTCLQQTKFCIGAVTTNFKMREGEVIPQYQKLKKKVECGAQFIINQIGFDSRKMSELRGYMNLHGMEHVPLIGNVYLLGARVAQMFAGGKIPGVVVTDALRDLCLEQARSADRGKSVLSGVCGKTGGNLSRARISRGVSWRRAQFFCNLTNFGYRTKLCS